MKPVLFANNKFNKTIKKIINMEFALNQAEQTYNLIAK